MNAISAQAIFEYWGPLRFKSFIVSYLWWMGLEE
jgi:hypothetical protein